MRKDLFGRYLLEIPDDHAIGEIRKHHVLYDRAFGFLIEEIGAARPGGVLLDIGANVGDTAAVFATLVDNPIVSVEGAACYLSYLTTNLQAIGDQARLVEGFVLPKSMIGTDMTYDEHDGTGNLVATSSEGATVASDSVLSVPQVLAACQEVGGMPALVKTDTDGCDDHLVAEFLDLAPDSVLYFECDTSDRVGMSDSRWLEVFQTLEDRDYAVIVFDNYGVPMLAARREVGSLLRDLSAYVTLQRHLGSVHVHYLDVWAFPPSFAGVYDSATARMRRELLPL